MLRHIVLVGFKPEATPDQRVAVHQAIEAMPGSEPEIKALTCGENVSSGRTTSISQWSWTLLT